MLYFLYPYILKSILLFINIIQDSLMDTMQILLFLYVWWEIILFSYPAAK